VYVLEFAGDDDTLAAAEAGALLPGVERLAPGVGTATGLHARGRHLAFTRRVAAVLGEVDAAVDAAVACLRSVSLDRTGTVAVRARDVRGTADVDTERAERALGDVLVDRGFAVDLDGPDHELRAAFAGDRCLLGWLVLETERGYGARAPTDRPFFQPGSMDPLLARAVVNLALGARGRRLVDPMCGTGGLLVEARLVGAAAVGLDAQAKMARGTRRNLRALADGGTVLRGDATRLPLRANAADAVAFDVPYGRQSKIVGDADSLVAAALREGRRVADRAVVVGDRPWTDAARGAGWTIDRTLTRRVHRSLTRHLLVLR